MLLVVTYSQAARTSLRNVCRTHEETVVRRFGRAALFEETEYGAFLALRLHAKHPDEVQLERTTPFNEFQQVPESIRTAVEAYDNRANENTTYARFAVDSPHPEPGAMKRRKL